MGTTTAIPLSNEPLTLCGWFYPTTVAAGARQVVIIGNGSGTDTGRWQIRLDAATLWARKDSTAGGNGVAPGTLVINTWQHGCGVFLTDISRTGYLAGAGGTADPTNLPDPSPVERIVIGANIVQGGQRFSGRLAHIAVWNVALTALEIGALAAGACPPRVRPVALVSYMPLLEETTTYANWRGARAWTPTGTPTVTTGPPVALCQH